MPAVRTSLRALRISGLAFGRTITMGSTISINARTTTSPLPPRISKGLTSAGSSVAGRLLAHPDGFRMKLYWAPSTARWGDDLPNWVDSNPLQPIAAGVERRRSRYRGYHKPRTPRFPKVIGLARRGIGALRGSRGRPLSSASRRWGWALRYV